MKKIVKIGGARIGKMNATWPFAKLVVDSEELSIYSMLHKFYFKKEDIKTISVVNYIPFIAHGIRISHVVQKYNKHIIFWCLSNPEKLIKELKEISWDVK
ncbi:MAG: hypothetical protein COW66_13000 [Flavobacteriaceae bacterium CG18_big_fil_WC_8_21_14_2_50_34_36]|nr:MAG: hypothetical protein COW66_13000 [Flavobacteriaceae bacterium CG18_big_fil_WC_8_21_14_2_50_34_36]